MYFGGIRLLRRGESTGGLSPTSVISNPVSSFSSLIAHSFGSSFGSMCPPSGSHMLNFLWRQSRTLSLCVVKTDVTKSVVINVEYERCIWLA